MATVDALDAGSVTRTFEVDGAGTVGNPFRNRVNVGLITTPNTFAGAFDTVTVGTTSQLLPSITSEGIVRIRNLDAGNLYLADDSLVATNITASANAFVLPAGTETTVEIADTATICIGADNNGAEFTLHATRTV